MTGAVFRARLAGILEQLEATDEGHVVAGMVAWLERAKHEETQMIYAVDIECSRSAHPSGAERGWPETGGRGPADIAIEQLRHMDALEDDDG